MCDGVGTKFSSFYAYQWGVNWGCVRCAAGIALSYAIRPGREQPFTNHGNSCSSSSAVVDKVA